MRRLSSVLVLVASLIVVPSALGDPSPTQTAAHDPDVNTVSGFAGPSRDDPGENPEPGDTPEEAVTRQFPPNTIETFRFRHAAGEENGSFSVSVGEFQNAAVDLDIFVYRIRANGTIVPDPVASAATLADPEVAAYASPLSDQPLKPSDYIVVVHNFCSNNTDPGGADGCEAAADPDGPSGSGEDTWQATVTFQAFVPGNKRPSVSLSGPTSGSTGEALTYTASAGDADGSISSVAFDLDGDGVHETNTSGGLTAQARFAAAGRYSVGVRVIDNNGAPAFASVDVRITGAPAPGANPSKVQLLRSFKLNRPVFGGRKSRKLVVSYRLREAGRAIVSLYRGKKRVKRLSTGNRSAGRTYRINISPKKLRKGATYTVRMSVRSTDGKRTQSARLSAKRL